MKRSTRSWRTPWEARASGTISGSPVATTQRDAGRALVEHLHVAGDLGLLAGGDGGLPDLAALGDLGEVDLAEPEAVAQREDERAR